MSKVKISSPAKENFQLLKETTPKLIESKKEYETRNDPTESSRPKKKPVLQSCAPICTQSPLYV